MSLCNSIAAPEGQEDESGGQLDRRHFSLQRDVQHLIVPGLAVLCAIN